jgi:branched-chain amino acid transport system permease protein
MTSTSVLQVILDALSSGSTYALLALGLAVVFSILGFVNFAHTEFVTLGGFTMWALATLGAPWWMAALATPLVVAGVAVVVDQVAFRPLRDKDPVTLLLTSFAVSFLIQSLLSLVGSSRATAVPLPDWTIAVVDLGGVQVPGVQLVTVTATVIVLAMLALALKRTSIGLALRAVADDLPAVTLGGIRSNVVISAGFAVSGALAGFSSLLLVARAGWVSSTFGVTPVITAFIAIVLGGARSLPGAAVGGYLIGASQAVLQAVLPTGLLPLRDTCIFGGVVVVLLVRPQGLVSLLPVRPVPRPRPVVEGVQP